MTSAAFSILNKLLLVAHKCHNTVAIENTVPAGINDSVIYDIGDIFSGKIIHNLINLCICSIILLLTKSSPISHTQ